MRRISFAPGEFYHIYNRGTEKRNIFLNKNDYRRFLLLLYYCNSGQNVVLRLENKNFDPDPQRETIVEICAYCLMPNHFHLLIHEKIEGGISRFMQKLSTGYTMYFNERHERDGVLFQGKFKSSYVNEDEYLKYLFSYIHLNPVKSVDPHWKENGISNSDQAKKYLDHYAYSSYPDYLGVNRKEGGIITKNVMPNYFLSVADYKRTINDWLSLRDEQAKVKIRGRTLY